MKLCQLQNTSSSFKSVLNTGNLLLLPLLQATLGWPISSPSSKTFLGHRCSLVDFAGCLTAAEYGRKKILKDARREGLLTVSGSRQGDVNLISEHFDPGTQTLSLYMIHTPATGSFTAFKCTCTTPCSSITPRNFSGSRHEETFVLLCEVSPVSGWLSLHLCR